MAHVTAPSAATIDEWLDYLFAAWDELASVESAWPEMDPLDREVFHLEWFAIKEPRLEDVERWARTGSLSAPQRERFRRLESLVSRYRPFLDKVFAED